jgi:ribosomal protein S12 methylthiotransferase
LCYLEAERVVKEGEMVDVVVKDFKEQDLLVEEKSE